MPKLLLPILLASAALVWAQSKPALEPKDYGQFESLGPLTISPDGKWVAYTVTKSTRDTELRVGEYKAVPFGAQPAFSSDSKWLAYSIGMSESAQDKARKDRKPVQNKLGLTNLANGEQTSIDAISSFAFSPDGAYLAMRRYAPEKTPPAGGPAPAAAPADSADQPPSSATLIVRQLATGRDTTFGNVQEFAWQDLPKTGKLLALIIGSEEKTGNGIQLFDPETGSLRVLDSSSTSTYSGLAWRKKSADLAALKSVNDDKRDGPGQLILAWKDVRDLATYEPAKDPSFPAGMRISSSRKPQWAEDGGIVFVGFSKWDDKPAKKKDDAKKDDAKKEDAKKEDEPEPAAVDVWHWRDADVMAKQKVQARMDRQRTYLAAWHTASGKFVPLSKSFTEQVHLMRHGSQAWVANWTKWAMERSIGRPSAELSLVDLSSGERTILRDRLAEDHYVQASPLGRYLLYFEDNHWWTINTATKATVNLTKNLKTSFVNTESDQTVKQKPAYGVGGWLDQDSAVLLYDKYDIWKVAPDGSSAVKLTDGAAGEIRHRVVANLNPDAESLESKKPIYVSLFGYWSKKSGYATLEGAKETHLVLEDLGISRLVKARDADAYAYSKESFEESPQAYLAGPALAANAKQVSKLNPFQSNYAWGRSALIEYKNAAGTRLQGALFYPPNYEQGKKYPMIVYMYEKLSDGLHQYRAPSERDYYNPGAITQHGYVLLMPDIVFKPREPGLSVADCVGAAVKKVIEMGVADASKIGIVGHSWGGFDTAYLATRTKLFAAGVAGAPITDLVSNYGNHHWTQGIAETDHIETGQQRMEVPIYEDLDAYVRNSALFNAHNMTTPLLIEVGDADGTVFYHQGVELYNVARRAGKNVVLIVYSGEDHGLRKKPNQIDYQKRIFAWFGHYLKGDPAESWIAEGEPYLKHQDDLKKLKQ